MSVSKCIRPLLTLFQMAVREGGLVLHSWKQIIRKKPCATKTSKVAEVPLDDEKIIFPDFNLNFHLWWPSFLESQNNSSLTRYIRWIKNLPHYLKVTTCRHYPTFLVNLLKYLTTFMWKIFKKFVGHFSSLTILHLLYNFFSSQAEVTNSDFKPEASTLSIFKLLLKYSVYKVAFGF